MVKRLKLHKLSLLGLILSNVQLYGMEKKDEEPKPQRTSTPTASDQKLARLKSLQGIPKVEQAGFRAVLMEEIKRKKHSLVDLATVQQSASSEQDTQSHQASNVQNYERELIEEYKREKMIEDLALQLHAKEEHGAPHVMVFEEAAQDVSELLHMEADDYIKEELKEVQEPTDVQIELYWLKQLENAIKLANIEGIKRLLAKKITLKMHDGFGDTPLHWALSADLAHEEKISLLAMLIEAGAEINVANNDGQTPVHIAALTLDDSPELLTFMRAHSAIADLSLMDTQGQTPLHAAVSKGRVDLVKLFLQNKADVLAQDLKGLTPLQVAFESHLPSKVKTSIVSDLIQAGADRDICNAEKTPLLFTAINKVDVTGVELLLAHGADYSATDARNRTALEFAKHKVEKSSNDNTRKVLDLVQSYFDGRKQPHSRTERTPNTVMQPAYHVSISVPLPLRDKVDIGLFRENLFEELQQTGKDGKTCLHRVLEKSFKDTKVAETKKSDAE